MYIFLIILILLLVTFLINIIYKKGYYDGVIEEAEKSMEYYPKANEDIKKIKENNHYGFK